MRGVASTAERIGLTSPLEIRTVGCKPWWGGTTSASKFLSSLAVTTALSREERGARPCEPAPRLTPVPLLPQLGLNLGIEADGHPLVVCGEVLARSSVKCCLSSNSNCRARAVGASEDDVEAPALARGHQFGQDPPCGLAIHALNEGPLLAELETWKSVV